jgi:ATP-binding cassette, subfamily B, multidrug efflux pump
MMTRLAPFRRFESLVDPFAPGPATAPPDRLWPFLKEALRPYRRVLALLAVTGLIVALMETGLIFYSGRVIDMMSEAGPDGLIARHGLELALAVVLILLLRPLAIGLNAALLNQGLDPSLGTGTRWRFHRHMLGQSSSYFQNDFAGRLANRVMQTSTAVAEVGYMAMEAIWYCSAYVLGALLILGQIDARLAIPMAAWIVVYLAFLRWIAPRVARASQRVSDARSTVTGRVVDAYTNIETVKLFAHGAREEAYAGRAMRRHLMRVRKMMRLMTVMSLGLGFLNSLLIVGVLGPGIWLWMGGSMTIGEVSAAAALTLRLNGMTGWIMWVTIHLFEQTGIIREGMQSISVPHGVTDRPGAPALKVTRGEIAFRGLTHHYGKGRGGLAGIDLTIRPGERVGLVGRSGAGKSSLVNLLLRFRDAEGGRIEIDGQDIRGVSQASLRRAVGVVTQDSSLLHRSVRENILYGNPDAGEAAMVAAARRAEAHDFIGELRDPAGRAGYDAFVGERGVKLSGGQRQRVAIARVILKDAPILVLDEATSALDSEVEAAIQGTLYGVMEGKTVIAIAHRLSTIAHMDRIVVLDGGRIVEQGSHSELLALNGLYATFWNRQSGGFINLEAAE